MHKTEPLAVTGMPVLGSAPLSMTYNEAGWMVTLPPEPYAPEIRPLAPVEFEIYATKILQALEANRIEIIYLRADLRDRTFARRCARFWSWLKGRFTWSED